MARFREAPVCAKLEDVSNPTDPISAATKPLITRGINLNEVLTALIDTVVHTLEADRGTLYLVDGASRTLTSMIAHLPELPEIRLSFGQGIAGTVAETGLAVNLPAAGDDHRFDQSFDEKTGYVTKSMLVVPLRDSEEQVVGVLQLLNKRDGHFTRVDQERALELAGQAGRVLEATSLHSELKQSGPLEADRPELQYRFNQIVGESEAMQRVYGLVEKAARTDATVLLQGESGTGKELIARAVHVNSKRRGQPFVKVDCTTLPEALIENELFGHEKGAFTGADKTVPGKFEVADGGTLFIDEIGELPLKLQGKLLRVLQDREFERVGGTKTIKANIRVICATHRDLVRMVDEGRFREDLYYRIRVVPVALPPLRERGEKDRLRLVEHFVHKFSKRHAQNIAKVTEAAIARIMAHDFPGNIRELENVIESAVVLVDEDGVIDAADLALATRNRASSSGGANELGDPEVPLADIEKLHIEQVLQAVGGNQSEAARRLGIGRNTLARKINDDDV
jgi:Nif-specific regulatory protein